MAFDILKYYNDHKGYYGDASLEDVAKDAYDKGFHQGEPDYDTWKKNAGIDSAIQEDINRRNTPPTFEDKLRSAVEQPAPKSDGNIVKSFLQGGAEGLTTKLPSMVGGALQFTGSHLPFKGIEETGKSLKDWAEEKRQELYGPEIERTGLDRIVYEGTKMLAPSIIPGGIAGTVARGVKGVNALMKVGKIAEATAAAKSAVNIGGATAAGLFGLSQAQQTKETAEKAGVSPGLSPYATGAIEAAGEFLGTKYLSKLFHLDEAEIVKRGTAQFVKDLIKTIGVETGTEIGQQAGEAAVEKYSGVRPTANPILEAADVIGPTIFMTLLTGGLAGAANKLRSEDPQEKEAAQYLDKLRAGAELSMTIHEGLKNGEAEGQPFTPDHALELIKTGQENGIYDESDIDRFKDKYPQLKDGLNGVIADNIAKKIDEAVTNTVPNVANNENIQTVSGLRGKKESLKIIPAGQDVPGFEPEGVNPEIKKFQDRIAKTESFLFRHADAEGTPNYNKYLKRLQNDKAKLAELTKGGEDNGTLRETETEIGKKLPAPLSQTEAATVGTKEVKAGESSVRKADLTTGEITPIQDAIKKYQETGTADIIVGEDYGITVKDEGEYTSVRFGPNDLTSTEDLKSGNILYGEKNFKTSKEAFNYAKQLQDKFTGNQLEAPAAAKQPWEYSQSDYVNRSMPDVNSIAASGMIPPGIKGAKAKKEFLIKDYSGLHKRLVKQALAEGKPVPESVLKDYPDLSPSPKIQGTSNIQGTDSLTAETKAQPYVKPVTDKYYYWTHEKAHAEVRGKPISLPGLSGQDFFIHKDGNSYIVAEGRTGLLIGNGLTQKDAQSNAQKRINEAGGIEKINDYIQRKIESGIISPRYAATKEVPAKENPPIDKSPESGIIITKGGQENELQKSGTEETEAERSDARRLEENKQKNIADVRAFHESTGNTWTEKDQLIAEQLFEDSVNKYLFHATYKEKLSGIISKGLNPAESGDYHYIDNKGKRLSFADADSFAKDFGDVLLRVKLSELDPATMSLIERRTGIEINYMDIVPAEKIEILANGEWKSLKEVLSTTKPKVKAPKKTLLNHEPPGGWTEADKVPKTEKAPINIKREAAISKYRAHVTERNPKTANEFVDKIVKLIDSRDGIELRQWMNGINPRINKLFYDLTGLPARTQKEVDTTLRSFDPEKWDNWQKEKAAALEKKKADNAARYKQQELDAILNKQVKWNGKELIKVVDLYKRLVSEGYDKITKTKSGIADVYRLVNSKTGEWTKLEKKLSADHVQSLIDARKVEPAEPKAEVKYTANADKGGKLIGQNPDGHNLYERGDGVRYFTDGRIRVTEPVTMAMTRGGVQPTINPDNRRDQWKTAAEIGKTEEPATVVKEETDLSTKSTGDLVKDMFAIINDHIGERGSVSTKEIDQTLYEKLKPFLAEIVKRAKVKMMDARAYLFGAVDSMPDGKAKDVYEAAANKYIEEENKPEEPRYGLNKYIPFKDLDASIKIIPIEDENSVDWEKGYRFEGEVSFPESLGERGLYQGGYAYKTYPTEKEMRDDILDAFKTELDDKDGAENIREAILKVAPQLEAPGRSPYGAVADKVAKKLQNNEKFTRNELFFMCRDAFGGTLAEGKFSAKDAYDALEMGINKYLLTISDAIDPLPLSSKYAESAIFNLKDKFELIPTQTTRTEEMDEFQQFSTPPALAYVANWVANLNQNDVYLEPSAGTGNLAIFGRIAGVKETIVNELAPRRAAILKELGFDKVYTENAEQINNILPKEDRPTVVVMNPPFSSTAGRMKGERKTINATVHIEQALKRLQPGGRLVAIVGEGMAADRPAFKSWWNKIEKEYQVRANIGISGKEYAKYGTQFGNQIIVIDKPKNLAISKENDYNIVKGKVDKIEDLINLLEGVRNERINPAEQREAQPGEQEGAVIPQTETGRNGAVLPATGGILPSKQSGRSGRTANVETGRNARLEAGRGNELPATESGNKRGRGRSGLESGQQRSERTGGPNASDNTRQVDNNAPVLPEEAVSGLTVEQRADVEKNDELTDAVYNTYKPAKLTIPNSKEHPGKLVESAAMASVEPIDPVYSPRLPEKAIKSGAISIAQLESVVYAGQAHSELLPDSSRKGYFIGDGTGVGKGREIAAILWDNWNQGRRKAVWLSQNSPLMKDAQRDIAGVGWDKGLVFDIGKTKLQESIKQKEGIGFVGYGTLRTKKVINGKEISRLNQFINWLGKDFDGVIIFDESHNMGNALPIRGKRGTSKPSATALAGIELQKQLPKARVVYVSATGATEVMNLAYAERLGLWGDKTPFPNATSFVTSISSGGITAMEMVAMNMKSSGVYMARSLAYDDVKYERLQHDLTPEQRKIYDELAGAWEIAQRDIDAAMTATGITDEEKTLNGDAKSHVMSAFWGTNQRFWNQIITSMQMPTVIKAIEKDIEDGYAPLIQLINTNEAAQKRAISGMEEDDTLENLDITPKEMLIEYVNNSFPVYQFEKYLDEEGHEKSRIVLDSKGNPVLNAEAVQIREDLLTKLASIRVPDGPLEIVLDHFGIENVAEVTGRSRRVVYKDTKDGRKRVVEAWGKNKGMADADLFMNDKKKILIFSQAGGTGRSYHADNTAKNKRLRRHYLVQPGWRADVAVQGLGRSHRTNQAQAPEWVLVTTNLEGQKRFISSIARRLNQLGALTKGSRETGNQGLFNSRDNLESQEAKDAFHQLLKDIYHNEIPDMTMGEFMSITGLNNIIDKETGALNVTNLPEINQFLNRILNMKIDVQNKMFGEFAKRLNIKVAQAMENGTLDVGVETIRAKRTEKLNEQVVYEDPKTKAKATYLEVELTHDAKLLPYESTHAYNQYGYVQNLRSGRIWALAYQKSKTDYETGDVTPHYSAVGANYNYQDISDKDVNNPEKYKKIPKEEAKTLWDADYSKMPKEVSERVHMVTGSILPIWDRLPQGEGTNKIYRLQVDGKNIIGRVIQNKYLDSTLKKLNAQRKMANYNPQDIFNNVLHHGYAYELSNGWEIKRRKVADDYRIELEGPDYIHTDELKKYGIFTERISYTTRYFIPADEKGVNAIKEIISSRQVVEEIASGKKKGQVTTKDVEFMHDKGEYAVREKGTFQLPTLEEVKEIFKGQEITQYPTGAYLIKTKNGAEVIISAVNEITPSKISLNIGYSKGHLTEAEAIAGRYQKGMIDLVKGQSDKWTLAHESVHFMEDIGVINDQEVKLLQRHIKNLVSDGKFQTVNKNDIGGAEDRAEFLAQSLQKEPKGLLGRIINKIQDFIDRLVNAFGIRTVRGIERDVKSGEIYNKETEAQRETRLDLEAGKDQYSIRQQTDPPVFSDPKVLNLYLKDETDAIVQTIMNKLHPKSMTWLETMLKSPEWFDHPQIQNIVKLFMRDRNEIYHETFNDLNMTDDVNAPEKTVTDAAKALKNKGVSLTDRLSGKVSPEYQTLLDMIDDGDTRWKRNKNISLDAQLKNFEDVWKKKGATAETIRVWKLYRQSYDKALDIMTRQLKDMIDQVTEEARMRGEKPDLSELRQTLKGALTQMEEWKGFYAPRLREPGNWVVQAYKAYGPTKEQREWYREHKGSELSAQRRANELKREGWTIYKVGELDKIPETVYQDVNAVATAKLIDEALEKLGKKSDLRDSLVTQFNEEILREVSDAIKARGFRSTMIHRGRGVVRGFVEDPIQRHLMYINNVSGGIAKARVARLSYKELLGEKIMGQQVGGIDPVKDARAYAVAQNYIQEQLRNSDASDRIIGLAKSIATFKFLGFNLRSLAVNMTAIMTTAPAAIHQYATGGKGSLTEVMREIARAGKDYGSIMAGQKLTNADEQSFIDEEHKKGWDDAQYTREALGEISKTHSRVWSTMMDASMYLFGKSEKWNRGTTMLAAYRLARKSGMSHIEAGEAAKTASDKAHGVYGKSTMPMWAQGTNPAAKLGQMMYVYSKFGHNYLQMLYDLGAKKHNIKAMMFAFLSPLVLAGGAAMPFKDAIFAFAGAILGLLGFDKDPEKWVWDEIRQHLGTGAEKLGRHGLTGAAGLDISGSLSIGVGIPKDFIDLTGAIGGVATELKEAGASMANRQPLRAAEHLLPSGFANPVRAYRESEEGVTTRNNRRVWNEQGQPYTPDTGATIGRAFGFRSTDQAVLSERTWEGHREQASIAEKRNDIYERYRAWILGGRNREEYIKIVKAVQEFNASIRKNKIRGESFITSQSLKNQVRRLMKPSKKERSILQE